MRYTVVMLGIAAVGIAGCESFHRLDQAVDEAVFGKPQPMTPAEARAQAARDANSRAWLDYSSKQLTQPTPQRTQQQTCEVNKVGDGLSTVRCY